MKKMNMIKSGAAAAVLAGLLAATPGVALGATIGDSMQPTIQKDWTVASAEIYEANKTENFEFVVTYTGYNKSNTSFDGEVKKGEDVVALNSSETVTIKGVDLQASGLTYTGTTKILGSYDFTQPGQYSFKVQETAGSNANITYSTDYYTVTVNVQWKEGSLTETEVSSVVVRKNSTEGTKQDKGNYTLEFDNGAKDNANLTVSKTVAGTAANTNDVFSYKLELTSGVTGSYDVYKGEAKIGTVSADQALEFELSHGESIKVMNLPVDATYKVTETDTDYTETVTVNDTADTESPLTAEGTIAKGENTVAYKNEKGFIPDTGITMNTLPFIGVGAVAVAGAVTLVISRRRREGEEF